MSITISRIIVEGDEETTITVSAVDAESGVENFKYAYDKLFPKEEKEE